MAEPFLHDAWCENQDGVDTVLVCDGILRMRHRNGLDSAELMEPGTPYEIVIDLWETALVFNAGHRIGLAVSSSNAPRFQPNPNTAEVFGQETHTVVAENTVFHSADRPSFVHFQVRDTYSHSGQTRT